MGARTPTEAEIQKTIVQFAQLRGYQVAHFRPAANRRGHWSTPMEGHSGFPDLILARAGSVFAWEIKGANGRLTDAQLAWLEALDPSDSLTPAIIEARHIRPDDLDTALGALDRGRWRP